MAALSPFFPDIADTRFKTKLEHYITHTKGGYFLRKFDLKNQSCYVSSVVYMLIGMFFHLPVEVMTEKIKRILNFRNFQSSILTNIIGRNAADVTSIRISSIRQLDAVFENGVVFLGLVTTGEQGIHRYGVIHHYFLLKRNIDDKYSILSSYGSSNVAMRQYQTDIEPELMDEFIKDLADPDNLDDPKEQDDLDGQEKSEEAKTRIDLFMRKFFLDKTYKTIQRKDADDVEQTYHGASLKDVDELQLRKNEEADIRREIGYYQKRPSYVMLFPNLVDIFKAEMAALELKDAMAKLNAGEITYDDYWEIYRAADETAEEVARKIETTTETIQRSLEVPPITLAKIAETVQSLSPAETDTVEGAFQSLSIEDPMRTPQKDASGRPRSPLPLSPFIRKRIRIEDTEAEEEEEETSEDPGKAFEKLDELGLISTEQMDEYNSSPEGKGLVLKKLGLIPINLEGDIEAEVTEGGKRKTRKEKKTKRTKKMKKMKKTKRVKRKSRKV